MLASHRRHAPLGELLIELDRWLAPSWIARRVLLKGVRQDEHVTRALGRGTVVSRTRLGIVLAGSFEMTVGGKPFVLLPGDFILVPRLADIFSRGRGTADEIIELDWDADAAIAARAVPDVAKGTLGPGARERVAALARALRGNVTESVLTMPRAIEALAAEGLPFAPEAVLVEIRAALARGVDTADQRLFAAIDETLGDLDDGPAVVSLEDRLGWSPRTISRRTNDLHARYGVVGTSGQGWRATRDFYRLVVGTVFASHPAFTTELLAKHLGYTSPDALCHAFANAGLPSPGTIAKAARQRAA